LRENLAIEAIRKNELFNERHFSSIDIAHLQEKEEVPKTLRSLFLPSATARRHLLQRGKETYGLARTGSSRCV